MLRAFSTRNGRPGTISYEKLHGVAADPDMGGLLLEPKLERSRSYPYSSSSSREPNKKNKVDHLGLAVPVKAAPIKIKAEAKGHPLFSLFNSRSKKKKKITAMPEFARYLEYVKEGGTGIWGVPPPSDGPMSYI